MKHSWLWKLVWCSGQSHQARNWETVSSSSIFIIKSSGLSKLEQTISENFCHESCGDRVNIDLKAPNNQTEMRG